MNFEELLKSRHSAINFVEDFEMTEDDFKRILDFTKLAPSPYNLQSTNFLIVDNKELKGVVYELSYMQHKIKTASAVVIVLGDRQSFSVESAKKIYEPMKSLKMLSENEYNTVIGQIAQWDSTLQENPNEMAMELHRIGAMATSFFIMSAKHLGFDTCVMHIQNKELIRKVLKIPEQFEMIMMLTIGKSVDKTRPRGYRKTYGELAFFNRINK